MAITDINTSQYFNSVGIQTFTAPFSGLYKFELWGASGGSTSSYYGGAGGYVYGYKEMKAGESIYLCIGGAGTSAKNTWDNVSGGFNGGGGSGPIGGYQTDTGGSGGGATSLSTSASTIANNVGACLLIAGGGGGASVNGSGGSGGGVSSLNGGLGSNSSNQTAPTPYNSGRYKHYHEYGYAVVYSSVGQGLSTGTRYIVAYHPEGTEHAGEVYVHTLVYGNAGGGGGGRYGGISGLTQSGSGGSAWLGLPSITFNGKTYSSGYGSSNSGNGRATVTLIDLSIVINYNGTGVKRTIYKKNDTSTNLTKIIYNNTELK